MKLPECRNPQHPSGFPKQMVYLEEKDETYVFACQACRDVNRVLSVHAVTSEAMKRKIRGQLIADGKILRGAPPRVQGMRMDESLMRERGRL